MNLHEYYDHVVGEINKIDQEIKYLQGKREAYNDMRLDLSVAIDKEKQSNLGKGE